MKVVSKFAPRIEGTGRCRMCCWHVETQGHHTDCMMYLNAQIDYARRNALQLNGSTAQINDYLIRGPVPWMTCRPVEDLPHDVEMHKKVVTMILDGAKAEWFNWIEPETPADVAHNVGALDRWQVSKQDRAATRSQLKVKDNDEDENIFDEGDEPF